MLFFVIFFIEDFTFVSPISIVLFGGKFIPKARSIIGFSMKIFERFESVCSTEGSEWQPIMGLWFTMSLFLKKSLTERPSPSLITFCINQLWL